MLTIQKYLKTIPKFNIDNIPAKMKKIKLNPLEMSMYDFFQILLKEEKIKREENEEYYGVDNVFVFYEGGGPFFPTFQKY